MQFTFTEEQQQLRDVVRRFLTDKSPTSEVRHLMETEEGFDRDVWKQLCQELGLGGLQIPEVYGGQGFSFAELGIVMEEMGRALYCGPYFSSSVLATSAILHAGNKGQKANFLPTIASGEHIATLAVAEQTGRWDCEGIALTATPNRNSYLLKGVKSYVIDGHIADFIVVAARAPGSSGVKGISLFVVDSNQRGVERRLLQTADQTRKQSLIKFDRVQGELLGEADVGPSAFRKSMDEAATALANEMVGGAQMMLDSAVDYANNRMQFGRPIGSFQAIKHQCANTLLEVELSKSAAYYAASAVAENDPKSSALASLAKASAADSYVHAAAACIQIHGGTGFTWDNNTHLWFKRAKSSEVLMGDPNFHRELMMQRWED